MATVIVQYKYSENLSREEAMERFMRAAEVFQNMDGLNSKQFTYDSENNTCLTVYNWKDKDAAEAFFGDSFISDFEKIVGTKPTYQIYDCLLMVDNRAKDVVVYV